MGDEIGISENGHLKLKLYTNLGRLKINRFYEMTTVQTIVRIGIWVLSNLVKGTFEYERLLVKKIIDGLSETELEFELLLTFMDTAIILNRPNVVFVSLFVLIR